MRQYIKNRLHPPASSTPAPQLRQAPPLPPRPALPLPPRPSNKTDKLSIPKYYYRHEPRSTDPLKVCTVCKGINVNPEKAMGSMYNHYTTFKELVSSVHNGCELCALFLDSILDETCQNTGVLLEEACQAHLNLDNDPGCRFLVSWDELNSLQTKSGEHRESGVGGLEFWRYAKAKNERVHFDICPLLGIR